MPGCVGRRGRKERLFWVNERERLRRKGFVERKREMGKVLAKDQG